MHQCTGFAPCIRSALADAPSEPVHDQARFRWALVLQCARMRRSRRRMDSPASEAVDLLAAPYSRTRKACGIAPPGMFLPCSFSTGARSAARASPSRERRVHRNPQAFSISPTMSLRILLPHGRCVYRHWHTAGRREERNFGRPLAASRMPLVKSRAAIASPTRVRAWPDRRASEMPYRKIQCVLVIKPFKNPLTAEAQRRKGNAKET